MEGEVADWRNLQILEDANFGRWPGGGGASDPREWYIFPCSRIVALVSGNSPPIEAMASEWL